LTNISPPITPKEVANALVTEGLSFISNCNFSQAQKSFEKALIAQPNNFEALHLLGTLFAFLKDYSLALRFLSKALEANPNNSNCLYNIGLTLQELKDYTNAIICYDQATAIKPDYAEAHCQRGFSLQKLIRYDEAIASYTQAVTINPNYADAFYNLGIVLYKSKHFDEALASYNQAITIRPDYAEAYYNRGITLQEIGVVGQAINSFKKAIALQPDYIRARWNLSLVLLLMGNFEEGWLEYESRWQNKELHGTLGARKFLEPLWLGKESLKDKTILLYAEQGLGDTIQFCRYTQSVSALGAKVILEVQPELVTLLNNLEGVHQIIARDSKAPEFDYQCPLLSLPLAFKTTLQNIPSLPRITTRQDQLARWQAHLGAKVKARIGIVWSGSVSHKNDHNRSFTLSTLLPYLPSDYEYISLQKEVRDVDKEALSEHGNIKHFGNLLQDFTDTAALCSLMDIIICVDTSTAHLAAALGMPTWLLLPYQPDWRWLLDRDDSPWYPSMKIYRQVKIGDWSSVFENVKSNLLNTL